MAHRVNQLLAVLLRHLARRARMRLVAQSLDSLGQITLEPAAHRLLAGANDLGDLRRCQAPLGSQQDHLGARSQPSVAGGSVQLLQSIELLRVEGWNADRFHGLLLRPHLTPLGIYLSVLSTWDRYPPSCLGAQPKRGVLR